MLCFVNLFAFLFMHNFKRQQSASMLLSIVACMALAIISLCQLKVPVITSLNYDGCSFIFTFHFKYFVSLAPLLSIHGMPCMCLFEPVSNWLSRIFYFLFAIENLANWRERGKREKVLATQVPLFAFCFIAKHRFNCFFSSVLPAICWTCLSGQHATKKFPELIFFIRFDVNVRKRWKWRNSNSINASKKHKIWKNAPLTSRVLKGICKTDRALRTACKCKCKY